MIDDVTTSQDVETYLKLFAEVTSISGISGKEKHVADFIRNYLEDVDVTIVEDGTANVTGGNCGNLIVVPGTFDPQKTSTALFAHMDTVRDTGQTRSIRENGVLRSDGKAQLGVDNRAGVALLLWFIKHNSLSAKKNNLLFVFTVAEETGLKGSKHLDLTHWNVDSGYVFDSALRPGSYIRECAGMFIFNASFKGKAAHSAVSDGKGISAIMMAATAVHRMGQVPMADGLKCNIGTITGGEATNVVPPTCCIEGEIRGYDKEHIFDLLDSFKHICLVSAKSSGGSLEWDQYADFEPYVVSSDSGITAKLEKAMIASGLRPVPVRYYGGSDANSLNANSIPAINLGIGAQNPHSDNEYILIEDIQSMMVLIQKLVALC